MPRIKIYLAFDSEILKNTNQQILKTFVGAEITNDINEAHLIISDNANRIIRDHDKNKKYVFLNTSADALVFSTDWPNVTDLGPINYMVGLMNVITEVDNQLQNQPQPIDVNKTIVLPKNLNALRILVVDDNVANLNAAVTQLGQEYNLTLADGFDEARHELTANKFDFALIDLNLPVSTKGALSTQAILQNYNNDIPYGLFLLLEACNSGANATIVTDLNHHVDPFSAAFDYYRNVAYIIDGKVALLQHASIINDVKDWALALNKLRTVRNDLLS